MHDDVIKWKQFPHYWPFVRGIHRSPVNSPHKGQWRGAFMFSLSCTWTNGWVNNHEAGDLRHHRAHCDVILMISQSLFEWRDQSLGLPNWYLTGFSAALDSQLSKWYDEYESRGSETSLRSYNNIRHFVEYKDGFMCSNVWDEITYPFANFTGATVEVWNG